MWERKDFRLNTSLKVFGTTTWPGGSWDHEYTAAEWVVNQAANWLQTDNLDRIARRIAFLIFIDDGDELTELSNVRFEIIKGE